MRKVNIFITGANEPVTVDFANNSVKIITLGTEDKPPLHKEAIEFRERLAAAMAGNGVLITNLVVTINDLNLTNP
jgi:hypothetical protein